MAEPEHFVVDVGDLGTVVDRMSQLADAGAGWINLQPAVDPDDVPPAPTGLFAVFSGRGPEVPLCTWVAGERRKGKQGKPSVGIQYASGTKAAARLADAGVAVPTEWRVVQDHPKRGLAIQVPIEASHEDVLRWLLRAGDALARISLPDRWRVAVHDGS